MLGERNFKIVFVEWENGQDKIGVAIFLPTFSWNLSCWEMFEPPPPHISRILIQISMLAIQ